MRDENFQKRQFLRGKKSNARSITEDLGGRLPSKLCVIGMLVTRHTNSGGEGPSAINVKSNSAPIKFSPHCVPNFGHHTHFAFVRRILQGNYWQRLSKHDLILIKYDQNDQMHVYSLGVRYFGDIKKHSAKKYKVFWVVGIWV